MRGTRRSFRRWRWQPSCGPRFAASLKSRNAGTPLASDFLLVGTKTITNTRVPIVLNLGAKLTNASIFGIAANSPGWEFKPFGGLFLLSSHRITAGSLWAQNLPGNHDN